MRTAANPEKADINAIHIVQQFNCFKYRLDRSRTLTSQLIYKLGVAHIEYYRITHPVNSTQNTEDTSQLP
jgi:hypothetical protein